MLCGKTPQGTRRDTCFKIKHFLIWHSFCYQAFIFYCYCQRVSKNDPGILVYGSPPGLSLQYGKARDIPEDTCACCAISIFFKKRSSLQGRESHVKK